jgi:hypothetical protein
MAGAEQRIASSQIWQYTFASVSDEYDIEGHALRLMQRRQHESVWISPVLEQGGGLEVLGLAHAGVLVKRRVRVAVCEATQRLAQGCNGAAILRS